jgi:bifunctional UDP-N-acetylglucosamine pyrophosphorylase/glucosamine-1-phosphate N-acetyltransferase
MKAETLPVVVIAAAGRAKRFSGEQKVLARVGGVPAICRVATTCDEALGAHQQVVVIGHEGGRVRAALGDARHRTYAIQDAQLGTGHALATALAHLDGDVERYVYFLCGDKPLLSARSLRGLASELEATRAAMVFLTGELEGDPKQSRQGRVIQSRLGPERSEGLAIVERATIDALEDDQTLCFHSLSGERYEYTRQQLLAVRSVNVSAYVWRGEALRKHIVELQLHPEKGEYFVTDLVAILRQHGLLVRAIPACDDAEGLGIDTRQQLVTANGVWHRLQTSAPASLPAEAQRGPADMETDDAVL